MKVKDKRSFDEKGELKEPIEPAPEVPAKKTLKQQMAEKKEKKKKEKKVKCPCCNRLTVFSGFLFNPALGTLACPRCGNLFMEPMFISELIKKADKERSSIVIPTVGMAPGRR